MENMCLTCVKVLEYVLDVYGRDAHDVDVGRLLGVIY